MTLRDYQVTAVDNVFSDWATGLRKVALSLPTGAGKTVVFSEITRRFIAEHPGERVLVLAHREELLHQATDKISYWASDLRVGLVQGASNQVSAPVIVASQQTLARPRRIARLPKFGLVIVDECFPAGTMVGNRPIELIKVGDIVPSWDEETGQPVDRPVTAVSRTKPTSLVRVEFSDEQSLVCTPGHPFLTDQGWVIASKLTSMHSVVRSTHGIQRGNYSVHPVWGPVRFDSGEGARAPRAGEGVLLTGVQSGVDAREHVGSTLADGENALLMVRDEIHPGEASTAAGVVGQPSDLLFRDVRDRTSGRVHGPGEPKIRFRQDDSKEPDARCGNAGQGGSHTAPYRAQAQDAGRKGRRDARAPEEVSGVFGLANRSSVQDPSEESSVVLRAGHCASDHEGRGGGGRRLSPVEVTPGERRAQGRDASSVRVAGVQVLEPGRDGTYGGVCPEGAVYNIEVEGTHTYRVGDGLVAHNCHRCMSPSYAKVLENLGCNEPDGPVTLGVTATFAREDTKRLTDFFEAVSFSLDITDLIMGEVPYLVTPKFKRVLVEGLDLSGVPISRMEGGKDLAAGELGEAMDRAGAPGVVAAAYREHAADRSGMIFCPTVASAEHVAVAMRQWGFTAEMLCGTTPKHIRKDVLARYNLGEIQVITNANLLGEGVDAPITSCIVIARPTMSKILFRQMVGRGLRLHPGKTSCLVLDVVGATGRNDLKTLNDVTDIEIDIKEDEGLDEAIVRLKSTEPREETQEGDAHVSGSLLAVDIDPWEIEAARGRPVKPYRQTPEEKEAARLAREAERAAAKLEKEEREALRLRRRYKHVPMRSSWFLRTLNDRWFIPIELGSGQKGFICTAEMPDGRWVLGLSVTGVQRELLGVYEKESQAAEMMMRMMLGFVEGPLQRNIVDPDARWRRKEASERAVDMAMAYVGPDVDFEEYHCAGQVSDFITWGKWRNQVDQFAAKITAVAMSHGTLDAHTEPRNVELETVN